MTNSNDKNPSDSASHNEREIIVNGRPRKWEHPMISFEQLAALAFPDAPADPNRIYTVTWKKGHDQGSMVAGDAIDVKSGTVFNVAFTNRS